MKALDEAARELMDDLLQLAHVARSEALRERLEAATGPCALVGGRERHVELVRTMVEQAKGEEARS